MKDWRKIIQSKYSYKDFLILDKPAMFCELFAGQNIPCVQVHSIQVIQVCGNAPDIVGFCGVFKWNDDEIISLDGDSYSQSTIVYGYSWFSNGKDKCLDILVGEDW